MIESEHTGPIRILIADDHAVVREGIKSILAESLDMVVVGEACDAVEAIEVAARVVPDVAVLDVQMPRGGGLEALRALRRDYPRMAVLILSFHSEDLFAVPFLREGAAGYLAKDNAGDELIEAIRTVRVGRKYVTGPAAEKLALRLAASATPSLEDALTAQELIVLSLLAAGRSVDQISGDLATSCRTIHRCQDRILVKTCLDTPASVLRYAVSRELRRPPCH